jgi:cytochrome c oxidase subunit 3
MSTNNAYYIPHKATWPVMATAGLLTTLVGFANYLNGSSIGSPLMMLGFAIFIVMVAGWFTLQSTESESGMYNHGVGISYRMGMMWFILQTTAEDC